MKETDFGCIPTYIGDVSLNGRGTLCVSHHKNLFEMFYTPRKHCSLNLFFIILLKSLEEDHYKSGNLSCNLVAINMLFPFFFPQVIPFRIQAQK